MRDKIYYFLTKKYKCDGSQVVYFIVPLLLGLLNIFGVDTVTKMGHKNEASFMEGFYLLSISFIIYRILKYKCQEYIVYKCRDCCKVFDEKKLENDSEECIFCHGHNIVDVKDYY